MRRFVMIMSVAAMSMLLGSCTALWNSASYGASDLYRTDNRTEVANRLKAEAEAERAEAEARRAQWEARLAEEEAARAEREYYASSYYDEEPNYRNIVADDYSSAYARRLYGFQSPNYRMPSSYYSLSASRALYYASAYDPAYYNVMVSGDQVWVEPKYITSMFGSWGAVNISFGLYSSPWNFGWSFYTRPGYYSWWGYPHYSWYDWNWNICYHGHYYHHYDWWWGGYYPHHHGHGYNPAPPRPPQHRPDHTRPGNDNRPGYNHTTGSGASAGRPNENLNGNRVNTGNRYQSPTNNRVESAVTTRPTGNSGSVSTGIYNGSKPIVGTSAGKGTGSTSTSSSSNRYSVSSNTTTSVGVAAGTTNNSHSSAGNFRGSSSTTSRSNSFSVSSALNSSSSTAKGSSVSGGGSTSTRRGTTVGSSSNSKSSSTSVRSSSSGSSNRSSSSSSFRSSSSSSSSNRSSSSSYRSTQQSSYNATHTGLGSSRSSSSSSSSGSYSSGSSRSGGGTTSSRR